MRVIRELKAEFVSRFADFRLYAGDFSLFGTPFNADIESVSGYLQMEVIEIQRNDPLKRKFDADDLSLIDFHKKYFFHLKNCQTRWST